MKVKHGTIDEDIYYFDDSGFLMGKILSQIVVTGLEKPQKAKILQPSARKCVMLVQGVGATGKRTPPFLIFAGKVLISDWFHTISRDWVFHVSPTG
jgi:hypothetical protein